MRKFTLLIVAVLMAITASAQKLDIKQLVSPVSQKGNMVARALPENAKPVKPFKLNKKARKAAGVTSIDDLTGTWMQIYYSNFDKTILSTVVEITKTEGSENSITINGWWGNVLNSEPIEATVDLAAGTVTVAPQLIYDGEVSVELVNVDAETEGAPLVGTIAEDGSIVFEEGCAALTSDGAYEYALTTMFVRPNGKMEFLNDGVQIVDVYIEQDEEEEKVYVYNFGDFGRTIELGMNSDKTIEVPSSQIVYTGTNGDFYLYGLDETAENLISLSATGTEKTITFDQDWTGYTSTQYWLGQNTGTTITLTDGSKFVYPAEIADVAATPANPTDLEYNVHKTYGPRILVDVPRVDKNGKKLRKDKLF